MPSARRPPAARRHPPPRRWRAGGALALLLLLAGCGGLRPAPEPAPDPAEVRARLLRLLPPQLADRQGWAGDIQVAFTTLDIPPTTENLCAVLAVAEQESGLRADPVVPGLSKIAREEIYRRARRLYIPPLLVEAALRLESPTGQSYRQRLDAARTEQQLSAIFEDFIGMVPLGQRLFGSLNPVQTGGPMQVAIAFAESRAADYPYSYDGPLRREVFTRRGGLFFGTAHLLDYPAHYDRLLYRFADFNAGWYASRNAAFQAAVARLTGLPLALDGDLVVRDSTRPGATERAVRVLGRRLSMSDADIRTALERGDRLDFEDTRLYEQVFALADRTAGKPVPRAVVPDIALASPKITRQLTTAWFADRVAARHRTCLLRGDGGRG